MFRANTYHVILFHLLRKKPVNVYVFNLHKRKKSWWFYALNIPYNMLYLSNWKVHDDILFSYKFAVFDSDLFLFFKWILFGYLLPHFKIFSNDLTYKSQARSIHKTIKLFNYFFFQCHLKFDRQIFIHTS